MNSSASIVITSINGSENTILQAYAKKCQQYKIPLIVIGDRKSPDHFKLEGCQYFSITDQQNLDFKLSGLLGENSYARKNLGYLQAIRNGSQVIIETDDDNLPLDSFWTDRTVKVSGEMPGDKGWQNVYRFFSDALIWPRGFPLEEIHTKFSDELTPSMVHCPIQQGLADLNPDVDAIYRLTRTLPVEFKKRKPVILKEGSYCPFNSQNTTWFREAFALLYIPSTCNFRVCDIWRSFIALAILRVNNWHLAFHEATVIQHRNAHNLLHDLEDEIPGILHNRQIMDELETLELKKGPEAIPQNLKRCYERLLALNFVTQKELILLDAWLEDLRLISE